MKRSTRSASPSRPSSARSALICPADRRSLLASGLAPTLALTDVPKAMATQPSSIGPCEEIRPLPVRPAVGAPSPASAIWSAETS